MKRTFDEIEAEMQKMREAVPAKKREAWKKYAGMLFEEPLWTFDKKLAKQSGTAKLVPAA